MEDHDETTEYSAMFEDDILLLQTDWDDLLKNKVKIDSWKELNNNDIKIHVNKAKDEIMDQLEKILKKENLNVKQIKQVLFM